MKIILSGPSGVGKDTLIDAWIEFNPRVKKTITATTRPPRQGEINGVSYHFYSLEEMQLRIDNDEFLEHMNVFGHIYGTPKSSVDKVVAEGGVAIIRVDVQGALELIPKMKDAISVFILPPSMEELKKRIVGRKSESKEEIEERLNTASAEIMCSFFYDNQIINDDISEAIRQLEAMLSGEIFENVDLADECMRETLNEYTLTKMNSFLNLAEKTGICAEDS